MCLNLFVWKNYHIKHRSKKNEFHPKKTKIIQKKQILIQEKRRSSKKNKSHPKKTKDIQKKQKSSKIAHQMLSTVKNFLDQEVNFTFFDKIWEIKFFEFDHSMHAQK